MRSRRAKANHAWRRIRSPTGFRSSSWRSIPRGNRLVPGTSPWLVSWRYRQQPEHGDEEYDDGQNFAPKRRRNACINRLGFLIRRGRGAKFKNDENGNRGEDEQGVGKPRFPGHALLLSVAVPLCVRGKKRRAHRGHPGPIKISPTTMITNDTPSRVNVINMGNLRSFWIEGRRGSHRAVLLSARPAQAREGPPPHSCITRPPSGGRRASRARRRRS